MQDLDQQLTIQHYMSYLLEREGTTPIVSPDGLLLYRPMQDGLYVQDIFVRKDARQTGVGRALLGQVEQIAKNAGLSKIYGSCDPTAKGSTESLNAMLGTGFKLHSSQANLIWLLKEI